MDTPILDFKNVCDEARVKMLAATVEHPYWIGACWRQEAPSLAPGVRFVGRFGDGLEQEFIVLRERGPRVPGWPADDQRGIFDIMPTVS